ncbi:MAG: hypothetical protein V1776_03510 [Candidatus Diapherotrites archaeon]
MDEPTNKKEAKTAAPKARKRKGVDKWKSKKWFNLLAPPLFNSTTLAHTPGEEPENVMNRILSISAREMTGNIKKSQLMLKFKVNNVQGLNAYTQLYGMEVQPGSVRRLVRRKSSKVEHIIDARCKDGQIARIKTVAIISNPISAPKRSIVRQLLHEGIISLAAGQDYESLLHQFISGDSTAGILTNIRKIAPIKRVDILKVTRIG